MRPRDSRRHAVGLGAFQRADRLRNDVALDAPRLLLLPRWDDGARCCIRVKGAATGRAGGRSHRQERDHPASETGRSSRACLRRSRSSGERSSRPPPRQRTPEPTRVPPARTSPKPGRTRTAPGGAPCLCKSRSTTTSARQDSAAPQWRRSSCPLLVSAASGSQIKSAPVATEEKSPLTAADFCSGLIVSSDGASTRIDTCSLSARCGAAVEDGERLVPAQERVSASGR